MSSFAIVIDPWLMREARNLGVLCSSFPCLEKQAILNFLLKTKYMKHPRFKLQFFMTINLQFHTSILG
jgi:hypothetical protein